MSDSCGCFGKIPKVVYGKKSEYFEDLSGSVAVHLKDNVIATRISWMVKLRKPLPSDAYVEAEFTESMDDIPCKVPVSRLDSKEQKDNLYVVSPELKLRCGIQNVLMKVYKDKTRQVVISTHKSQIISKVDTENCTLSEFRKAMASVQK